MSKLTEYLKLIPVGIENKEVILEGIKNNVKHRFNLLPEDQQDEIIRRRVICEVCPYNSKNAAKTDGYTSKLAFDHCILCSCALLIKTASLMSNCGAEIWNLKNPKEHIDLKWKTYIKPE